MTAPASPTKRAPPKLIEVTSVHTSSARSGLPFSNMNRFIHLPTHDAKVEDHHQQHAVCKTCAPKTTTFCTNYVSTTKYNVLTFIPKNLFEQFQRVANFYFLVVAIISFMSFSPKTPIVSVAPLVLVLAVSALKEAIEDYARFKMDKSVNNARVKVWRNGSFVESVWQLLQVGDLVHVSVDHSFPADIVVLKTSLTSGGCAIETANLDGETNLKNKQSAPETQRIPCSEDGLDFPRNMSACIAESSGPNKRLDNSSWTGNLSFGGSTPQVPLSMDQLLLRGCTLRNTKWIVGFVVFTGSDTKLMLNNAPAVLKRSQVDRMVDKALYVMFFMQFALCTMGAILNYSWMDNNSLKHWYLPYRFEKDNRSTEAGLSWFTYLVLLDIFIPISLYVSMEMVKFAQAWLINNDLDMYHARSKTPAQARTSNLNEELGQISYVFSDKTGTLTDNIMTFVACSVSGVVYGLDDDRKMDHLTSVPLCRGMPPPDPNGAFKDGRLLKTMMDNVLPHQSRNIDEFLTLLAVCHTVIPDYPGCKTQHVHRYEDCKAPVNYQAASPDEKALVVAAKNNQYYCYHREPKTLTIGGETVFGERMTLNILGEIQEFDVLEVFKFTSERARMSIIVRDPRDGQIKVYSKGADAVMIPLLSEASKTAGWDVTSQHLTIFAQKGLRTLVCGYRVLSLSDFLQWFVKHRTAKAAVDNRDRLVAASQEEVEKGIHLLGATAIEDKLQQGVPETIAKLAQANIKLWMLTGDKSETAINIGRSCKLLTPDMEGKHLIKLVLGDESRGMSERDLRRRSLGLLDEAWQRVSHVPVDGAVENEMMGTKERYGLVITGQVLGHILPGGDTTRIHIGEDGSSTDSVCAEQVKMQFLNICRRCQAVIACRVAPLQKAEIVSLVKHKVEGAVTLAIGDGANDVSMIKSAHVGIGISGEEGLQAVMASDYAIAQFRFLEKLLLVHGTWSYRRTSLLILYSFYKNIIIAMTQIWFAINSAWSAQMFYDPYSGSVYNIFFTSLPVIAAAITNRDVSAQSLQTYPALYRNGQQSRRFNLRWMLLIILEAIGHSLVMFYFPSYVYLSSVRQDGQMDDQWMASTAMYTCLVFLVNLKIALETTSWTWFTCILLPLSVFAWFVFSLVYTAALMQITPNMTGVAVRLYGELALWLLVLLTCVACLVPDVAVQYIKRSYFPSLFDIVAEREKIHGSNQTNQTQTVTSSIPSEAKEDVELAQMTKNPANVAIGLQKSVGEAEIPSAPFPPFNSPSPSAPSTPVATTTAATTTTATAPPATAQTAVPGDLVVSTPSPVPTAALRTPESPHTPLYYPTVEPPALQIHSAGRSEGVPEGPSSVFYPPVEMPGSVH